MLGRLIPMKVPSLYLHTVLPLMGAMGQCLRDSSIPKLGGSISPSFCIVSGRGGAGAAPTQIPKPGKNLQIIILPLGSWSSLSVTKDQRLAHLSMNPGSWSCIQWHLVAVRQVLWGTPTTCPVWSKASISWGRLQASPANCRHLFLKLLLLRSAYYECCLKHTGLCFLLQYPHTKWTL